MQLRILRSFTWEHSNPIGMRRIGGKNPMHLVPHDRLQYWQQFGNSTTGEWLDVPVLEEEKPEHPHAGKERLLEERMATDMRNVFEVKDK